MKHLIVALVAALFVMACSESKPAPAPTAVVAVDASVNAIAPAPTTPAPVTAPTPAPEPTPTPAPEPEKPKDPATLTDALDQFKIGFEDSDADTMPPGMVLFAVWSAKHLTLADVKTLPKTKYALVMKDPDEERGKQLCFAGRIIEIEIEKTNNGKFAHLGIMSDNLNVVRAVAVKSTGDLVAGSRATLCGVVVGKYSYANSGGGTTHTVRMVGIFDIPANR